MKITCNRADELRKKRDEYEAGRAVRQEEYDKQERAWNQARYEVEQGVKSIIEQYLSEVKIGLDIDVKPGWGLRQRGLEASVSHGEYSDRDTAALRWTYKVELDKDGNVEASTSSWSGLDAVDEAHINDLKESVKAIEILSGIDWKSVLDVALPEWKEYVTMENPRQEKHEDYDTQILEAELDELVGTDTLVKFKEDPYATRFRRPGYAFITKSTPKFYYAAFAPYYFYNAENLTDEDILRVKNYEQKRIPRDELKYKIVQPLETATVPEYIKMVQNREV